MVKSKISASMMCADLIHLKDVNCFFFSTLVGVYLPGEKCLFYKCEVEWTNSVYIGDILSVSGTVKEIDKNLTVF